MPANASGITAFLAERAAALTYDKLSAEARFVAADCLLDWFGVSLAGSREPLVDILAEVVAENGGAAQAGVVGRGFRTSMEQAALLNGAMSHALDYDDVNMNMPGHPTVPVAPAVLALGEARGASGREIIAAFAAGVETECRVGRVMGVSHYDLGWHPTGTLGAIGAAAASANLLRLDAAATAHAIGIAATQAAGLKSVFGTMCKPLHAGHAAQTGLQAARLAARGFTSNPAILDVDQGFVATQSARSEPAAALLEPPGGYYLPQALFKYHATCYFTHAPMDALAEILRRDRPDPHSIARVVMTVDPSLLRICDIERPVTGLEAKFSLRLTGALALLGANTADNGLFVDAMTQESRLVALRDKIEIDPRGNSSTAAEVAVHLTNGTVLRAVADAGVPMTDLQRQREKLRAKFLTLAIPVVGRDRAEEAVALCAGFADLDTCGPLLAAVGAAPA